VIEEVNDVTYYLRALALQLLDIDIAVKHPELAVLTPLQQLLACSLKCLVEDPH